MPAPAPQVYATVIEQRTGRIVSLLGPYATAAAARTACGIELGELLIWTRNELDWVAESNGREFRVPADPGLGA